MTRATVYGSPRRPPHPVVLAALGVLLVGVLVGTVLALQAVTGDGDPVVSTSFAASGPPSAPAPASSRPAPTSAPPSSPPPSTPPPQPLQLASVRGQGSNLCLDLQPDQPTAGGLVLVAPCTPGAPNQRWQVTPAGGLVNGATGLCLAVAGGAVDDNARVQQEACGDGANQKWRLFVGADGTATFAAVHSNKCLIVAGGGTAPGTPVQQFACTDTPAQRWFLQPV